MLEKDSPILITGSARSGAGMIAGLIHLCGAFGGEMSNKKGLYENDSIRDHIVKPYLEQMGVDPLGQYPILQTESILIPKWWKREVISIIDAQGYKQGTPWMYKDTKMCQMWPVWNFAFPNARWIIVRRRTGDITQSCVKTAFMQAFKDEKVRQAIDVKTEEEGWLWWVHEHEKKFIEMMNEGLNCKIIWPERMVHGDYQQLYETLDWLGLRWKTEVLTFIDPLLWSNRKKERRA